MRNSTVGVPLLPAWLRWAGVAAVAAVIFYLSVITAPPETTIVPGRPDLLPLDKWRHFLAYAAFGGALAYATVDWEWRTRWLALAVLAVVVAYGFGIELWQSTIPDRYFGMGDAYANALGGVLATPLFLVRDRVPFVPIRTLIRTIRS
jgi:VanZ family protein